MALRSAGPGTSRRGLPTPAPPLSRRAPLHVLRPPALAVHARRAPSHRGHGGDGGVRLPGRHRAARIARLAAGAGLRRRCLLRAGGALRAGGGGHGAARVDRACPRHVRAPYRGAGAARAAPAALRQGGGPRPRPLRAGAHRRGAALDDRRGRAARDLVRRIPPAAPGGRRHPPRGLRVARVLRLPGRRADVRIRDVHPVRAVALPALGRPQQRAPVEGVPRIRGRVPRRGAGARHPQGVRAEHRARPAARATRARGVPEHDVGARHQRPDPRPHRHRHCGGQRGGARVRGVAGHPGPDGPRRAARGPDDGHRGVPPPARPPRAAAHRHVGAGGGGRRLRGARCPSEGRAPGRAGRARRPSRAHGGVRERVLRLPRRAPRRAPGALVPCRRRRAGGVRGGERGREVHHRAAAAALLRSRRRRGAHRRARSAPASPRGRLPRRRGGEPGHVPLPRHGRGQPALRQARCGRGGDRGGGAGRERPRVHHPAAAGLRHGGGRAGHQALRRAAPAHRDRPRAAARCADPDPGRGPVRGGRGERGGDPAGAGPADAGAHHPHLRAPAVERDRGGTHPGARPRIGRGDRRPRLVDARGRRLLPADGRASRGEGGGRTVRTG